MNEQNILNGHTEVVTCLVFSKKHNWFFSGSADSTIRCWKEDDMKDWITRQPDVKHVGIITCLILD
jgi:WD40 repeat protein